MERRLVECQTSSSRCATKRSVPPAFIDALDFMPTSRFSRGRRVPTPLRSSDSIQRFDHLHGAELFAVYRDRIPVLKFYFHVLRLVRRFFR